jgi:hypothetical protein
MFETVKETLGIARTSQRHRLPLPFAWQRVPREPVDNRNTNDEKTLQMNDSDTAR